MPIASGVAGAAMATLSAVKFGMDPQKAALLTAGAGALGFAAAAKYKRPGWEQVAIGVGAGGACLAALPYMTNLAHGPSKPAATAPARQADGDHVTRSELNDAVARLAEQQKQSNCDTLDAIRHELRRSLVGGEHSAANENRRPAPVDDVPPRRRTDDQVLYPYGRNESERDDAGERDADERDADAEFWRDDEGERDADPDAWLEADERDANLDEWRDAEVDGWRNDIERDAALDEQTA